MRRNELENVVPVGKFDLERALGDTHINTEIVWLYGIMTII